MDREADEGATAPVQRCSALQGGSGGPGGAGSPASHMGQSGLSSWRAGAVAHIFLRAQLPVPSLGPGVSKVLKTEMVTKNKNQRHQRKCL